MSDSRCHYRHHFDLYLGSNPKPYDLNMRCACGAVRYGHVEEDLMAEIAALRERVEQAERERDAERSRAEHAYANYVQLMRDVGTVERERDEAVQHYQEVGQHWHDAETRVESLEALNAELRGALVQVAEMGAEIGCQCLSDVMPGEDHTSQFCVTINAIDAVLARTPEAALKQRQAEQAVIAAVRAFMLHGVLPRGMEGKDISEMRDALAALDAVEERGGETE